MNKSIQEVPRRNSISILKAPRKYNTHNFSLNHTNKNGGINDPYDKKQSQKEVKFASDSKPQHRNRATSIIQDTSLGKPKLYK